MGGGGGGGGGRGGPGGHSTPPPLTHTEHSYNKFGLTPLYKIKAGTKFTRNTGLYGISDVDLSSLVKLI